MSAILSNKVEEWVFEGYTRVVTAVIGYPI